MYRIPRNNLVLNIAKISNAPESFLAKVNASTVVVAAKTENAKIEKTPKIDAIAKNHIEKPIVTVAALKRGEDNSILDRINHGH